MRRKDLKEVASIQKSASAADVKRTKRGSVTLQNGFKFDAFPRRFGAVSKGFQMVRFKGSTQEKRASEIFRFGYGKAVNDKRVPDRVGSAGFVLHKWFVKQFR